MQTQLAHDVASMHIHGAGARLVQQSDLPLQRPNNACAKLVAPVKGAASSSEAREFIMAAESVADADYESANDTMGQKVGAGGTALQASRTRDTLSKYATSNAPAMVRLAKAASQKPAAPRGGPKLSVRPSK